MMDEVLQFYAPGDFHDMAGIGVIAVRILMPCQVFHDNVVVNGDFPCMVLRLLDRAEGAGLKAILVLVGGTAEDVFWGWDCRWRNAGRPPRPTTTTTTTNATAPPRDAPSPVDLDSLRRDVLALFLVNDSSSSTSTLTAAGRGRPDDAPSSSSSYDYYGVSILARFPPRELGVEMAVRTTVATTTTTPAAPPSLSMTSAYYRTKA
jgi:hypothetical protein